MNQCAGPGDFLADELRRRTADSGIAFDFNVQIAEAGDVVNDATVPLPASRKVVNAGRLVIDKVEAGNGGACDKILFNPPALPKGMGPSDAPTLIARPGAYAISLSRRLSQ